MTVEELRELLTPFPPTAEIDFDHPFAAHYLEITDAVYEFGRVIVTMAHADQKDDV